MPKAVNPLDPQTGRRNRLVTQTLAQDVTNFLQAFRPLQKSGIYPDRPSGQTRPIMHCIKTMGNVSSDDGRNELHSHPGFNCPGR